MKRQHPIQIFYYATKRLWLLLIPLLRGLIVMHMDVSTWLQGAWLDLLVIIFIMGTAYLRWYFTSFSLNDKEIIFNNGILTRSQLAIPYSCLCSVLIEKKFLLRPLKADTIYMDTYTGMLNKYDIKITVSRSDSDSIINAISENNKKAAAFKSSYQPRKFNLVFFSFAFSSTLSGALFISTLIIESSKIVGDYFEKKLLNTVDDIKSTLFPELPPIAIILSLFIITAWLISFIGNLIRYLKFKIYRQKGNIFIENGFLTKREYCINLDKINYVDLRQNLLMKIFSVMSVHVSCSGYGKSKNELPVLVPITTKQQVITSLNLLLPAMPIINNGIKPRLINIFRYIWVPLVLIAADIIAIFVLVYFFESFMHIITFSGIMAGILHLWLLIVKITSFFTTKVSFSDLNFTLRYSKLFAFHTILVSKDKIVKITLSQSFFQKATGTCDIRLYSTNEFVKCHHIMAVDLKDTVSMLKSTGLSNKILGFNRYKQI